MYKVFKIKKEIPQDLPTHWSIYKDDCCDPVITVWTNQETADRICGFMNETDK